MINKHIQSLINQVRADIATRKIMPEYGSTPDVVIERIKTINETQRSFSLETVEALLNALDADKKLIAAHEQEPVYLIPIEDDPGRSRCLWLEVPATNWLAKAFYQHPAPFQAIPDEIRQWIDDVVEYLNGGLEADGELEAEGSIEAKRLLSRHAAMLKGKSERDKVRDAHAEWSQKMFGDVGPVGPLKHLSKEALEAAAEPGDLSEWADMQFLLWDAQRRAGITDEQINLAMIEKLAVNKTRSWPAPKDGEPRLHIKSAEGGSQ